MSITLLQLRTQARERADMVNSTFISDSELNNFINSSVSELHDILINSYGSEYFVTSTTFSTVSNQADYDLPADFYKLKGVDVQINGTDYFSVKPFNFNERNRYQNAGAWSFLGLAAVRYRIVGDKLRFAPIPDNNVTVRLWYQPVATILADDADTLNNFNGYHEYILVDTAIKMLQKEESDVSVLVEQKRALIKRIEDAAQNRDAANAESVTDVDADNLEDWYWRTDG